MDYKRSIIGVLALSLLSGCASDLKSSEVKSDRFLADTQHILTEAQKEKVRRLVKWFEMEGAISCKISNEVFQEGVTVALTERGAGEGASTNSGMRISFGKNGKIESFRHSRPMATLAFDNRDPWLFLSEKDKKKIKFIAEVFDVEGFASCEIIPSPILEVRLTKYKRIEGRIGKFDVLWISLYKNNLVKCFLDKHVFVLVKCGEMLLKVESNIPNVEFIDMIVNKFYNNQFKFEDADLRSRYNEIEFGKLLSIRSSKEDYIMEFTNNVITTMIRFRYEGQEVIVTQILAAIS